MDWKNFGEGWRRASYIVPGWDCRVECKHEHKGNHGIHNEEWIYAVSDGEYAVSLRVGSGIYPSSVMHCESQPPRGWDLELHSPWTDDEEAIRRGDGGHACAFIEANRCYVMASSIHAGETLFAAHGAASFDQPETFWEAFQAKAKEWIGRARTARAQQPKLCRCPRCEGRGVVEEPRE